MELREAVVRCVLAHVFEDRNLHAVSLGGFLRAWRLWERIVGHHVPQLLEHF
jgi:hypothetical protein